jgi:hypothetical protein
MAFPEAWETHRSGSNGQVGSGHGNVRYGSKADMAASPTNVRFTPNSGHRLENRSSHRRTKLATARRTLISLVRFTPERRHSVPHLGCPLGAQEQKPQLFCFAPTSIGP